MINAKRKLGPVTQAGLGLILALVVISGIVSFRVIEGLLSASDEVSKTHVLKTGIVELEKMLVDLETGQRGFLITGKEEFLDPYNNARRDIRESFDDLKQTVRDTTILKLVREVESLSDQKVQFAERVIEQRRKGEVEEMTAAMTEGTGKRVMDDIRFRLNEIHRLEDVLLADRKKYSERLENLAVYTIVGSCVLVLLIGVGVSLFLMRRIIPPVREVANGLAAASSEIAATVEQHEKTALQQASSVNETTATMDELEASFRQVSDLSEATAERARQAVALADEGNRSSKQALNGMTELKEKVAAISEQILDLSEVTSQIGNVTNLVADLANQTNMLALNAAVEAARAGEHGKGFAVVATEIRKLADQSRKSAEKIATLVSDIQKATNTTVMVTEEGTKTASSGMELTRMAAATFNNLSGTLSFTLESSQQAMLSIKQQLAAVKQVTKAMADITTGSKETAAGISQTKVGVDRMKQSAQNLRDLV